MELMACVYDMFVFRHVHEIKNDEDTCMSIFVFHLCLPTNPKEDWDQFQAKTKPIPSKDETNSK